MKLVTNKYWPFPLEDHTSYIWKFTSLKSKLKYILEKLKILFDFLEKFLSTPYNHKFYGR